MPSPKGRSGIKQAFAALSATPLNRDNLIGGLGLAAVIFAVDQASKWAILHIVDLPAQRIVELLPFLNLRMAWNSGVSFGLFQADGWLGRLGLIGFALAVVAFLIYWLNSAENRATVIAIGMVVGGALGNVLDRVVYGAVVDFVDFHAFGYHFYTFNVADTAISLGVVLLIFDALFLQSPEGSGTAVVRDADASAPSPNKGHFGKSSVDE